MEVIEFNTPIQDGLIHLPKKLEKLEGKNVKVLIIPIKKEKFDVKKFFGVANKSKKDIDAYLEKLKKEWDIDG